MTSDRQNQEILDRILALDNLRARRTGIQLAST